MDENAMNLGRICRCCLKESGEMISLFTMEENSQQHEPRLIEMLMSTTLIQMKENDGLPCQICLRCAQQLYSAFTFRQMCELSDVKLKKCVSKGKSSDKNDPTIGGASTSTTGVKVEIPPQAPTGNVDIIDFNTMFNPHIQSIKVEARDSIENPSCYEGEVKKDLRNSTCDSIPVRENEKCTQTAEMVNIHNCSQCQKKFNSLSGLSCHMKRHINPEISFCSEVLCGKFFVSRSQAQKHKMDAHSVHKQTPVQPFSCKRCKMSFVTEEILKRHGMIVHGKIIYMYSCEHCNQGYNILENYQSHLAICKAKKYACLICKKSCRSNEDLMIHKNEVHGSDENCSIGVSKVEELPIELVGGVDSQVNGFLDSAFRSLINSEVNVIPHTSIKEEPFDELLDEAERENQILENDEDNYTGALLDDMDNISEEIPSDCSEYKPLQLKKKKSTRGRKRQFDGKKQLKYKKLIKTDENGEYPCTFCSKVFTSSMNLKVHMSKHTGDSITFSCLICEKSFNNVHRLRRHEIMHETMNQFKCNSCEKTFNRQDHLNKHMWSHMDTKPHNCDLCPKGFFKVEQLERHRLALHSGKLKNPKTAFCSICNRGFTTAKYLETHMRMHTGDKTFTCKVCDKSFNSKWHLKEHTKWHSAEKPFLCSECGQRFIRNDYLVIHMRRHKGEKPYKCKFCGKGFPRATDLTVHERYHTGEKTHLCTICGKGFQRQYNLTVHLRVHTGEKPYVCSYCGKRFAQGNDLKSHVRRHTGERFNCDVCGEGFIQGYHLTQHKRSVHGIDCTSHIRRVEKHPEANPQNASNLIPKHHTRTTPSVSSEDQPMPPLRVFSSSTLIIETNSRESASETMLQPGN